MTQESFGGPEVLQVRDVAEPHAGPGEVGVRVSATGLNPVDWKIAAFLTLRQPGQAQAVASAVITGLEQRAAREPTTETLSLCGAFHLVLAIAAARENDRPQAY